jgi:hypothetical protein
VASPVRRRLLPLALLLVLAPGALRDAVAEEGPDVGFLDAEAARRAIVDDSTEPYFERLQPMEMRAKAARPLEGDDVEALRAAYRERVQASVREFTDEEKASIRGYLRRYHERLVGRFPRLARLPWRLLKVSDEMEGRSYTRGACLVLTERDVARLVEARRERPVLSGRDEGQILFYAHVLVFARRNRERVDRFFAARWKLLHPERIERGDWLREHQCLDVDHADADWVLAFEEGGRTRWVLPAQFFDAGPGPKRLRGDATHDSDRVEGALELEKTEEGFRVMTRSGGQPVYEPLWRLRGDAVGLPGLFLRPHPDDMLAGLVMNVLFSQDLRLRPEKVPALRERDAELRVLLGD